MPRSLNGCNRAAFVFNQYFSVSINSGKRGERGASMGLDIQIRGPATPVPKQWLKYIANVQNSELVYLAATSCELGVT